MRAVRWRSRTEELRVRGIVGALHFAPEQSKSNGITRSTCSRRHEPPRTRRGRPGPPPAPLLAARCLPAGSFLRRRGRQGPLAEGPGSRSAAEERRDVRRRGACGAPQAEPAPCGAAALGSGAVGSGGTRRPGAGSRVLSGTPQAFCSSAASLWALRVRLGKGNLNPVMRPRSIKLAHRAPDLLCSSAQYEAQAGCLSADEAVVLSFRKRARCELGATHQSSCCTNCETAGRLK